MKAFPHEYRVAASGASEGTILLESPDIPSFSTTAPPEFGGPGGHWSPETLLMGAAADCFVLTFRAIAQASKLAWTDLRCEAKGTLDRVEGATRFTHLALRAILSIPQNGDADRAKRILEKAERGCLITNSLKVTPELTCEVTLDASRG